MSWRYLLFLAALGLAVYLLVAVFQHTPGYMDAEYYYAGGLRLAGGKGFTEPFIWNYLDNPPGLPHPSHTYWMPLASLVAYLGILLSGSAEFPVARWGFILAAACVPVISAILAHRFTPRRDAALLAGLLAVFSPFYLPYLPTSDTFGLVMLLGGLWLLTAQRPIYLRGGRLGDLSPLLLGLLSGLMHLARADGVIWLIAALLAAVWLPDLTQGRSTQRFSRVLATLLGYLLVMGPWLLRNQGLFGSLLTPSGGKALWFVEYDDLYAFPGALVTPARWWASGINQIVARPCLGIGSELADPVGCAALDLPLASGDRWIGALAPRALGAAGCLHLVVDSIGDDPTVPIRRRQGRIFSLRGGSTAALLGLCSGRFGRLSCLGQPQARLADRPGRESFPGWAYRHCPGIVVDGG